MKALILAAGKGSRLKQLTADRPKPMLEIGGEPLLARHVRGLRQAGVTQIAINLHHAPEVIVDYFGAGAGFDVQIVYSYEPELLGTAGAAKLLEAFLDEPFFVVYGDVFTNIDLAQLARVHVAHKARAGVDLALTMALYHVPNPTECGLVELTDAGRVTRFVEKPSPDQVFTDLANAGLLVCDVAVLHRIPPGVIFDFGRDVIPELLEHGIAVFGNPITSAEYLIDIGTPAGLARAQELAELPHVSATPV